MNYWEKRMLPELGLFIGDKIRLVGYVDNPYTVTSEGLEDVNGYPAPRATIGLITGNARPFVKLPWKPQRGDCYYYYEPNGAIERTQNSLYAFDLMATSIGNYSRTKEELQRKELEILKALGLTEWLS